MRTKNTCYSRPSDSTSFFIPSFHLKTKSFRSSESLNKRHKKAREKKLLLVDLDGTLIDTASFKKKLFETLDKKSHLGFNNVENIYENIRGDYNKEGWPLKFAAVISERTVVDQKIYYNLMFRCINKIRVKKTVLEFVKKFDGAKILFTLGDSRYQNAKVDSLKLRKHFDKVIVVAEDKLKYLISAIHDDCLNIATNTFKEVVILDDRNDLFDKLTKYPWIKLISPNTLL